MTYINLIQLLLLSVLKNQAQSWYFSLFLFFCISLFLQFLFTAYKATHYLNFSPSIEVSNYYT